MDVFIKLGNDKIAVKELNNSKSRKILLSWLNSIAGEQQLLMQHL